MGAKCGGNEKGSRGRVYFYRMGLFTNLPDNGRNWRLFVMTVLNLFYMDLVVFRWSSVEIGSVFLFLRNDFLPCARAGLWGGSRAEGRSQR
jgi:hypothetical protein